MLPRRRSFSNRCGGTSCAFFPEALFPRRFSRSCMQEREKRRGKALEKRRKRCLRTAWGTPPPRKHKISAEGRARIAEAQRRRWAAAKKSK